MKKRKFFTLLLICAMIASYFGGVEVARAETTSKTNFITLAAGTPSIYTVVPGEPTHFKIPVKLSSYNYGVTNPSILVTITSPEEVFDSVEALLTRENVKAGEPVGLSAHYETFVEFDLMLKDTTTIGLYKANIEFRFSGYDYENAMGVTEDLIEIELRVRTEKAPTQLTVDRFEYNEDLAAVGATFDLEFGVKNEGEIAALNTYFSVNFGSSGMIPNYTVEKIRVGDLAAGQKSSQKVSVKVLPDTEPGMKNITIEYTYKDADGKGHSESRTVYVNLLASSTAPSDDAKLIVKSPSLNDEVSAGTEYELKMELENIGKQTAKNIVAIVPEGGGIGAQTNILPMYGVGGVSLESLEQGAKQTISLPLSITKNAGAGLKEISVQVTYEDSKGTVLTAVGKAYITIVVPDQELKNDVVISNVRQSPAQPVIGENLTVTLTLTNNGNKDIANLMLYGENLSSNGFEPLTADGKVSVGSLAAGESREATIEFRLGDALNEGMNELKLGTSFVDANNVPKNGESKSVFILNVKKLVLENDVVLSNMTQSPAQPVAGDTLTIAFQITNNGNGDIKDLVLYGKDLSSSGFEPLSADIKTKVGDLASGESRDVVMSFRVGSGIAEGMNKLKLAAEYTDASGSLQMPEFPEIFILNVKQVTQEQLKNNVTISNIAQSPASPVVGENVTISFTVTNNGTKEITNLKFSGTGLGTNSFEPISSEVYTNVGTIPAGDSRNVSMTFKVGTGIPEGFNQLGLAYTYTDGNGDVHDESTSIYVLNVKNESSVNNSKPKLIVSDFSTDSEELRAGTIFNFTFKLKNTHTVKAAKNIKVTVTQEQNIFSTTQGSNSFYIDVIAPGEEAENTLPLKVKSDTATGAYEIKIKVEYEYDDMSQADMQAGGVSDENLVKLQAVENARPTVQNLSIGYGWDTPTVNQATSLMFYFYNMGKSTLDNVYITLEGDFQMESGTMQIIGSVGAGSSSYQEISIVPTMEGMAKGTMVVHFEDSNGDEVTKEFEIPETYVQGDSSSFDPGGWDVPDYPTNSDDIREPKKPLMPVWAYILCLVGALGAGTLITRGIMIKVHKKKLMNSEEI